MSSIDVDKVVQLQKELTMLWHTEEPSNDTEGLMGLIEGNHMKNFSLWHREDEARQDDLGFEHVYRAKRDIDCFNQERNNFMEKIDRFVVDGFGGVAEKGILHTETPGMIIDRLSILALKEYHMQEEAERQDAPAEQREKCAFKLKIIQQQLGDLRQGLKVFLEQVAQGERYFKVYYQFKMYNDPSLNPRLYKQAEKAL